MDADIDIRQDPALADPAAEARAQYRVGAHNDRAAAEAEDAGNGGRAIGDYGEFLCTCGRSDCDEVLMVDLSAYDGVRRVAHRFLVAPGHATAIDEVVGMNDDYWVVDVKEPFRLEPVD